jgi:hypothetical protein
MKAPVYHQREQEVIDAVQCFVLRSKGNESRRGIDPLTETAYGVWEELRHKLTLMPWCNLGIGVYASAMIDGEERWAALSHQHNPFKEPK